MCRRNGEVKVWGFECVNDFTYYQGAFLWQIDKPLWTAEGKSPALAEDGMLRILSDWRRWVDEGWCRPFDSTNASGTMTDLFYQGQRPAVDVGISVSRVGGSAQTKAVKSVSGTLRLDLAAYRELKAFTQFGSDLDKSTQDQLNRGARMTELLKQGRYSTLSFEEEAVAVYAGGKGFLDDVPVSDVVRFRNELIEFLRASHADVLKKIHDDAKFTPESEAALNAAIDAFKAQFVA